MGARAKRRLAVGTIAALVIVGAVAVFVIASSGSSRRNGSPTDTAKPVYGTFGAFGITYGARRSQVRARFGAPDQKRNGCWIYHVSADAFHGIKLSPQTTGMDAVRYCFFSGVVAVIENHWPPGIRNHKKGGEWLAPLTYGCGGGPCKLQS